MHANYLDFACFGPQDGNSESYLQSLIIKSTICLFSKQNKSAHKKSIQTVFSNKRWFPGGSVRVMKLHCHQFHFLTFLYESHLSKAHKSADMDFLVNFLETSCINPCYDLICAEKRQVRRSRSDGASSLMNQQQCSRRVKCLASSCCLSKHNGEHLHVGVSVFCIRGRSVP